MGGGGKTTRRCELRLQFNQMWWPRSIISAIGMLKQKHYSEFEANLACRLRLCLNKQMITYTYG